MLDLLRPHLAQAYRRRSKREHAAAVIAALERGFAEHGTRSSSSSTRRVDRLHQRPRRPGCSTATSAETAAAARRCRRLARRVAGGARRRATGLARSWSMPSTDADDPAPMPRPSGGSLPHARRGALPSPGAPRAASASLAAKPRSSRCSPTGAGVAEIAADLYLSPATVRKHLETSTPASASTGAPRPSPRRRAQ